MLPVPLDDPSFSKLARQLTRFDARTTIAAAAGLLTVPDFATATVRLEALANLACHHCGGTRRPAGDDLRRWINDFLGGLPLSDLEDPLEDVFISAVATPAGVYRVFEGVWESNDAYLQDALDCLVALDGFPGQAALIQQIRALLILSDAVCDRRHLERWAVSDEHTPRRWVLPPSIDPAPLAAAVTFSTADLGALGIQPADIEPFLLPVAPTAEDDRGAPPLERRPLVWFRRELILASPPSVSAAIRARVLDWAVEQDALEALTAALREYQWSKVAEVCVGEGHAGLALDAVKLLPRRDPALPIDEMVVAFDSDKLAHIVLVHDDLMEAARGRIGDLGQMPDDQQAALSKRLSEVARVLAAVSMGGGLTLVIFGGLGRGRLLKVPSLEGIWCSGADSAHNLLTLLRDPEWDLLRLWRMLWQEEAIAAAGVMLWNPHGLLTLAGYWQHHAFSLVPKFVPFPPNAPTTFAVSADFLLRPRAQRRREDDIHAAPVDGHGRSVVVRRLTARSYFSAMQERPIYVAEEALKAGVLAGVVESAPMTCWVTTDGTGLSEEVREFQYNLWEATLEWLDSAITLMSPQLEQGSAPIRVDLRLEETTSWEALVATKGLAAAEPTPPTSYLDIEQRSIRVLLKPGFLALVARAVNDAERALLRVLLDHMPALYAFAPEAAWPNLDALVEQIFSGPDARKLHVLETRLPTDLLARRRRPEPLLVPPEERAFWELGMAWRAIKAFEYGAAGPEIVISDRQEAVRVLRTFVDAIWTDLRHILQALDRESVIRAALENAEEIRRDREWWRHTARAMTSIPTIRGEVAQVASRREGARAVAAAADRTIVEMAVCESPQAGGRPVSRAALGTLIAGVAALLERASDADAIGGGPPSFAVRMHPNGFVDVEQPWQDEVVAPYTRAFFEEDLHEAVASYARYVAKPDADPQHDSDWADDVDRAENPSAEVPERNGIASSVTCDIGNRYNRDASTEKGSPATRYDEPTFVRAFATEYGLTPRKLIDAVAECIDWGVERRQAVLNVRRGDLAARLAEYRDFTSSEVNALLRSFALVPRPRWDETPHGFRDADWFPWRFRRRLSLIARPFVQLDDVPATEGLGALDSLRIVVSVGQCEASLSYLLDGLHQGWFQQEFVTTAEMRSYLGEAARQRGEAFTQQVASECRRAGWDARTNVPMSQLGASSRLGDVDVLAWRTGDPRLLCIECKRLRPARTVAEMLEVLTRFRGDAEDRLGVHMARIQWVRDHLVEAGRGIGAEFVGLEAVPLLVTSAVVPMQFVYDLPIAADRITPLSTLLDVLKPRSGDSDSR